MTRKPEFRLTDIKFLLMFMFSAHVISYLPSINIQ